jgi:hypothetical protein
VRNCGSWKTSPMSYYNAPGKCGGENNVPKLLENVLISSGVFQQENTSSHTDIHPRDMPENSAISG